MAWRDQLQPGSFRGVAFLFDGSDGAHGRRVALHEYPLRDKPYAEDLGRKAREFNLNLYVLGDNYMAQRDRLIEAVEQAGVGELVHPRFGSLNVVVMDCRGPQESTREGGMARFSITFVEAGEKAFPGNTLDTQSIVNSRADDLLSVSSDAFLSEFSLTRMPEFVVNDALAMADDWLGQVLGLANISALLPAPVTSFLYTVNNLRGGLGQLIRTPASLASEFASLMGLVGGIFTSPVAGYRQTRPLWSFTQTSPASLATATGTGKVISTNRRVMGEFLRTLPVVTAARMTTDMTFESFDQAAVVRDELAEQLDVMTFSANDQVFPALQDLRAAVIEDITRRGADLARIVSYTPAGTLPALVIAHLIYQDATQSAEIVARNKLRHPGFVVGGQALEVLSNGR